VSNAARRRRTWRDRGGRFLMEGYRDIAGPFDRIVSVGMLELSASILRDFSSAAPDVGEDGVMVLHSIGSSTGRECDEPLDHGNISSPR